MDGRCLRRELAQPPYSLDRGINRSTELLLGRTYRYGVRSGHLSSPSCRFERKSHHAQLGCKHRIDVRWVRDKLVVFHKILDSKGRQQ